MNNKYVFLLGFFFFCHSTLYGKIDADVNIVTYYQDDQPFIEVNIHIVGSSVTQKKLEQAYVESRANVLITIEKDNEILDFRKYALVSPKAPSASDFIDLKRFTLQPGQYTVNIELTDQLDISNTLKKTINLDISPRDKEVFSSATQLLYDAQASENQDNPFYKYGYVLLPTAYNFFHQGIDKLIVFEEIYGLQFLNESSLAAKISIINTDKSDAEPTNKFKRLKIDNKVVILESFDISEMKSGNYKLMVEIINKTNDVLHTSTTYFQRSNPSYDAKLLYSEGIEIDDTFVGKLSNEELEYNLKALAPLLPQSEITVLNVLLSEENIKGQKFFLFNYWNRYNPVKPEESFNHFLKIAKAVDVKFYSTVGRGFETDRGYIFLKYGRPDNVISVENEPSAPPYEIWFYDKLDLTGETNMKFLFYNPSLGGNDFQLLHSTSRFEVQNRQWELELYRDAPNDIDGNPVDATSVVDNVNRRAREYFEDNN